LNTSEQIERELCSRLVNLRLSKNINQTRLAELAGLSRRTISRMENGDGVSLDTFIRVMMALGMTDHLQSLLPSADIRPIERVARKQERKHASSPRKPPAKKDWQWGDS